MAAMDKTIYNIYISQLAALSGLTRTEKKTHRGVRGECQPSTSTHPAPLSAWKAVSKLRECGGG